MVIIGQLLGICIIAIFWNLLSIFYLVIHFFLSLIPTFSFWLLSPLKGLYCSPYKDLVRRHSGHNGIQECVIFKRKYPCTSRCFFRPQERFIGMSARYKWPDQDKNWRSVVVRSEIAGTGSPGASYQLSGYQVGSKIRGICFYTVTSFIAIFLFVLMLVAHPFVLLRDQYQRSFHNFVAKIWASMTIAPFLRLKIRGSENLPPRDSPAVYVSNHQSFLDIYALLTLGRNFKFVSKTAIFLYPVVGWAMYLMGTIPLKRMDRKSQLQTLKRCMELVKNGGSVFLFPEGTRSRNGSLGTFKNATNLEWYSRDHPLSQLPQANPGFNNSPFKFTKYSNAYMLVYIRESDKEKIICNVDEKDVAEHLRIRLKKEQEEKVQKRKEKAKAHLYTIIKVARDEDLHEQIGKNIFPEESDFLRPWEGKVLTWKDLTRPESCLLKFYAYQ